MRKLLYLSNLRLPTEKAYGIQITKMCEAFAEAGVIVELVYPYRKNPIKANVFDYYSVKSIFKAVKLPALDLHFFGALDKTVVGLKSFISAVVLFFYALFRRLDIIYSRDELILFLISFLKKRLVFEAHRFSPKRKFFYGRFKNLGIKIVVISEAIKKEFLKFGFNEKNVLIAHDGVDLKEFDLPVSKEEAREKVGLSTEKKIIMYTGHLFEWKGAQTLLQTARKLQTQDVIFVFVGGMEYDIEKFKEKAKGLSNVLIVGYKPHKEIPFYLKAADIVVLPNSAEEDISSKYTSPLKLFEYMASGRPIVASDLPSVREILKDSNAILVKPDNLESLAEGVERVLNDKILADNISYAAFEKVKNYTWQKRAKAIVEFLCFQS